MDSSRAEKVRTKKVREKRKKKTGSVISTGAQIEAQIEHSQSFDQKELAREIPTIVTTPSFSFSFGDGDGALDSSSPSPSSTTTTTSSSSSEPHSIKPSSEQKPIKISSLFRGNKKYEGKGLEDIGELIKRSQRGHGATQSGGGNLTTMLKTLEKTTQDPHGSLLYALDQILTEQTIIKKTSTSIVQMVLTEEKEREESGGEDGLPVVLLRNWAGMLGRKERERGEERGGEEKDGLWRTVLKEYVKRCLDLEPLKKKFVAVVRNYSVQGNQSTHTPRNSTPPKRATSPNPTTTLATTTTTTATTISNQIELEDYSPPPHPPSPTFLSLSCEEELGKERTKTISFGSPRKSSQTIYTFAGELTMAIFNNAHLVPVSFRKICWAYINGTLPQPTQQTSQSTTNVLSLNTINTINTPAPFGAAGNIIVRGKFCGLNRNYLEIMGLLFGCVLVPCLQSISSLVEDVVHEDMKEVIDLMSLLWKIPPQGMNETQEAFQEKQKKQITPFIETLIDQTFFVKLNRTRSNKQQQQLNPLRARASQPVLSGAASAPSSSPLGFNRSVTSVVVVAGGPSPPPPSSSSSSSSGGACGVSLNVTPTAPVKSVEDEGGPMNANLLALLDCVMTYQTELLVLLSGLKPVLFRPGNEEICGNHSFELASFLLTIKPSSSRDTAFHKPQSNTSRDSLKPSSLQPGDDRKREKIGKRRPKSVQNMHIDFSGSFSKDGTEKEEGKGKGQSGESGTLSSGVTSPGGEPSLSPPPGRELEEVLHGNAGNRVDLLTMLYLEPNFLYALSQVIPRNKYKYVTQLCLDIFGIVGSPLHPILRLVQAVVNDSEPGTFMRTDSLCTTLLSKYAEAVDKEFKFLSSILSTATKEVLSNEQVRSTDPLNGELALDLTERYMKAVFTNPSAIPKTLRVLFSELRSKVVEKGLGNGRSAVGGLVLLRIIVPVISTPQSFGLFDGDLESGQKQYVIFASRMIQCLSNGTFPRSDDMAFSHDFLKKKQVEVEKFLDQVSLEDQEEREALIGPVLSIEDIPAHATKVCEQLSPLIYYLRSIRSDFLEFLASTPVGENITSFMESLRPLTPTTLEKGKKKKKIDKEKKEKKGKEKEKEKEKERERGKREKEKREKERKRGLESSDETAIASPPSHSFIRKTSEQLMSHLLLDATFLYALENSVSHQELKSVSKMIISILAASPAPLLPLVNLLKTTVSSSPQKGTIARLDNVTNTLLTLYFSEFLEAQEGYLKKILEPPRHQCEQQEETFRTLSKGEALLKRVGIYTNAIFQSFELLPKPLIVICSVLRDEIVKAGQENWRGLIGGILLSRIIVPAVGNPLIYDSTCVLSLDAKKSLVPACKILQCLSSGTLPRGEDMEHTHEFLKNKSGDVERFLDKVSSMEKAEMEKIIGEPTPEQISQQIDFIAKRQHLLSPLILHLTKNRNEILDQLANIKNVEKESLHFFLEYLIDFEAEARLGASSTSSSAAKKNRMSIKFGYKDMKEWTGRDHDFFKKKEEKKGEEKKSFSLGGGRRNTGMYSPPSSPPGSLGSPNVAKKSLSPTSQDAENKPFWKRRLRDTMYETERIGTPHPFFEILSHLEMHNASSAQGIFVGDGGSSAAFLRLAAIYYPKELDLASFSLYSIATGLLKMLKELPTPLIPKQTVLSILDFDRKQNTIMPLSSPPPPPPPGSPCSSSPSETSSSSYSSSPTSPTSPTSFPSPQPSFSPLASPSSSSCSSSSFSSSSCFSSPLRPSSSSSSSSPSVSKISSLDSSENIPAFSSSFGSLPSSVVSVSPSTTSSSLASLTLSSSSSPSSSSSAPSSSSSSSSPSLPPQSASPSKPTFSPPSKPAFSPPSSPPIPIAVNRPISPIPSSPPPSPIPLSVSREAIPDTVSAPPLPPSSPPPHIFPLSISPPPPSSPPSSFNLSSHLSPPSRSYCSPDPSPCSPPLSPCPNPQREVPSKPTKPLSRFALMTRLYSFFPLSHTLFVMRLFSLFGELVLNQEESEISFENAFECLCDAIPPHRGMEEKTKKVISLLLQSAVDSAFPLGS